MNANRREFYNIVGGPSKDRLVDAFKYAYSADGSGVPIDFQIVYGYTMPLRSKEDGAAYVLMAVSDYVISEIAHEDGSGESFNLCGYCRTDLDIHRGRDMKNRHFKAYYNARTRTGTISFS